MSDEFIFQNPKFEQAVRQTLNRMSGPISAADVEDVKEFVCCNYSLQQADMEILCCFRNLESLDIELDGTDLPFLRSFPKLKELDVVCWKSWEKGAAIDCTALSGLTELEGMCLSGGMKSNITFYNCDVLAELKGLKELWFHEFGSVDMKFLENMPWLEKFSCGYGKEVKNIDSIGKLVNLKELELTDLSIDNLRFLGALPCDMTLTLCALDLHDGIDLNVINRFPNIDIE